MMTKILDPKKGFEPPIHLLLTPFSRRQYFYALYRNHGIGMKWLARCEREIGKPELPDVTTQPHEPWRPYDD